MNVKENKHHSSKHKNEKVLQRQEFYCKITKGFVWLLNFTRKPEILLKKKGVILVLNVDHYIIPCILQFNKKNEIRYKWKNKLVPEFTKYLRIILGITIILIGSASLFHLVFDSPPIKNEQESFFNGFYQTLLIGFGIWMISKRNKPVQRNLSKTRLYRSLFIMIGAILALAAAFFFFG